MRTMSFLMASLLMLITTLAQAQDRPGIRKLDRDASGTLTENESTTLLRLLVAKKLIDRKLVKELDQNNDGLLTDCEMKRITEILDKFSRDESAFEDELRSPQETILKEQLERALQDRVITEAQYQRALEAITSEGPWLDRNAVDRLGLRRSITDVIDALDEHLRELDIEEKKTKFDFFGFRLRQEWNDVTLDETNKERGDGFKSAKPAIVSYTRDYEDSNDIWVFRAAIARPFRISESSEPHFLVVPGAAIHRVSNDGNTTKEVEQLEFRLGLELEFSGAVFDAHYLRLSPVYATDFGFDSEVLGFEFEWEPSCNALGMGVSQQIFDLPLEYRLRLLGKVEYGHVLDAGGVPELRNEHDFLRGGARATIDLWPIAENDFFENLHFFFTAEVLHGFNGKEGGTSFFEAGFDYKLTEEGQLTLEVSYRKGDAGFSKQDVDVFSITLGYKF